MYFVKKLNIFLHNSFTKFKGNTKIKARFLINLKIIIYIGSNNLLNIQKYMIIPINNARKIYTLISDSKKLTIQKTKNIIVKKKNIISWIITCISVDFFIFLYALNPSKVNPTTSPKNTNSKNWTNWKVISYK